MKMRKPAEPIIILLVEDSPADARLIRETMKDYKIVNTLHHVKDGIEAMAFLRREDKYAGMPRPDLVLLDLNMPRKDGRETLAEIKADPDLKRIPVVILTVSNADEDVLNSYNLYANCYITKPLDLEEFVKVVKGVENFWFSIVHLPPNGEKV